MVLKSNSAGKVIGLKSSSAGKVIGLIIKSNIASRLKSHSSRLLKWNSAGKVIVPKWSSAGKIEYFTQVIALHDGILYIYKASIQISLLMIRARLI